MHSDLVPFVRKVSNASLQHHLGHAITDRDRHDSIVCTLQICDGWAPPTFLQHWREWLLIKINAPLRMCNYALLASIYTALENTYVCGLKSRLMYVTIHKFSSDFSHNLKSINVQFSWWRGSRSQTIAQHLVWLCGGVKETTEHSIIICINFLQ